VLNDVGPFIPWARCFRLKGYITRGKRFASVLEVETYLREVCAPFGPLTDEQWQHLARHGARRGEDGEFHLRYEPGDRRRFARPHRSGISDGAEMLRGIDLWSVWSKVTCPVLVLRGADSEVLTRKTLDEMRRAQARPRERRIPGRRPRAGADERRPDRGGQALPAQVMRLLLLLSACRRWRPSRCPRSGRGESVTTSGLSAAAFMACSCMSRILGRRGPRRPLPAVHNDCGAGSIFTP